MTLAAAVNNAASYVWGNCTYFVAKSLSWVPGGLGNAADWLANAKRKGLTISSTAAPGDVVVYGPGHGYDPQYGHVAVVKSVVPHSNGARFIVEEMNYKGLNIVDTRQSTMAGVAGFIQPPGSKIPIDPGAIASGIGSALDIPGAIASAGKNISDTLNPATWLMTIWNDHLKPNVVRIVLVVVGLWIIGMGLKMLLEEEVGDELQSSGVTPTPSPAPSSSSPTPGDDSPRDYKATPGDAAADAPEAAAIA